jgi:hypothetical protein
MASETGETAQTSGLDVEQALHHVQIDLDDLGVRRERLAGGDPWTNSLAAPKAGLSLAAECRVVPASGRVAARPGAAAVGYLRTHAQKTRIEITEFSRSRDSPRMCPPTQKKTPWRRAIF